MPILVLFALVALLGACGGSPSAPTVPTPVPPSPAAPAPTPSAVPTPAPSAPPPSEAVVLRRATIHGANGHSSAGRAEVVRQGERYTLELRNDFRIDSGNNDVYLTNDPEHVDANRDLNLGALRQLTGAQSYPMPGPGDGYRYVVLWCRPFRVPIGLGELR